jgi:hypothetical protein
MIHSDNSNLKLAHAAQSQDAIGCQRAQWPVYGGVVFWNGEERAGEGRTQCIELFQWALWTDNVREGGSSAAAVKARSRVAGMIRADRQARGFRSLGDEQCNAGRPGEFCGGGGRDTYIE